MVKVVVGLSGGVDSSVSAYLLKQQGYDVTGVFMQNWQDDEDGFCTIKEDSLDAIAVADCLGIDIEIVNFAKEYQERVFSYFLQEYAAGRTPNPDVFCNSEIKFKAFLEYALKTGADYIATGHYVTKITTPGSTSLARATDLNKDQSYFLYRLSRQQIEQAIFPLSALTKPQVREIAHTIKLPTANKRDSTGICFIGERPFRQFLQKYLHTKPGHIISPDGTIMAKHEGLMYYTIGQRKGLGIGGLGDAWFVVGKNLLKNELIVVQGHNNSLLLNDTLTAQQLSFIAGNNEISRPKPGRYSAKIRYRTADSSCTLSYLDDDTMQLIFDTPQWAISPGQSVVLYDGNICLGGGIIS